MQRAGGAPAQRRPLTAPPRRAWLLGLAAAFAASRITGWAVEAHLSAGTPRIVLPHLLSLTVLHNHGVAFGLMARLPPLATVALALTVLAVVFYNRDAWLATGAGQWGLGLMLGGALGNIVERLRFGYVLDYLDVHVWPVFNLADVAIVAGAGLLALALLWGAPGGAPAAHGPSGRGSGGPRG